MDWSSHDLSRCKGRTDFIPWDAAIVYMYIYSTMKMVTDLE